MGYMVIWVLGVMVPLLGIVVFSFFSTKGIRFIFDPTFNSYVEIAVTGRYEVALRSLRLMATVTLIELLIAFPFALWLAKGVRSYIVKITTFTLLTVPFFLTPAARTIVWRVVLGREGLINTVLLQLGVIDAPLDWLLFSEFSIHLAFIGPYFPAMVWPIFLAMALIDDELLEASADLGGSPWHTLRYVIIPLSMPGIVAGVVFTFVPMLGDNVVPKLVGGRSNLAARGLDVQPDNGNELQRCRGDVGYRPCPDGRPASGVVARVSSDRRSERNLRGHAKMNAVAAAPCTGRSPNCRWERAAVPLACGRSSRSQWATSPFSSSTHQ